MEPTETFKNLPTDKQQRVLEGALEEFAARGYGRASLNTLTSQLGISKGSIFQYFKDKPGLVGAVFEFAVSQVKNHLRRVRSATQGDDVFERIRRSLFAGLALIQENPRLFRFYLRIVFEGDVPFRAEMLRSIRVFSRDYLLDLLEDGVRSGQIKPDLDLKVAAFILDAVLERFLIARTVEYMDPELGLCQADAARAAQLVDSVVDALRQGLGAE
jgi:AcrR family transcriptional regulator